MPRFPHDSLLNAYPDLLTEARELDALLDDAISTARALNLDEADYTAEVTAAHQEWTDGMRDLYREAKERTQARELRLSCARVTFLADHGPADVAAQLGAEHRRSRALAALAAMGA